MELIERVLDLFPQINKEIHKEGGDKLLMASFEVSISFSKHRRRSQVACFFLPFFYRTKFSSQHTHLKIAPLSPRCAF